MSWHAKSVDSHDLPTVRGIDWTESGRCTVWTINDSLRRRNTRAVLVSDRNSVSAESIGRNYGYRFRSRNFFYRNRNFFSYFKKFQKISKNFMYFCFLGEYKFLKTWNWTQIFKSYLKILKIWQQIWSKGLFYDWKNTPYYW